MEWITELADVTAPGEWLHLGGPYKTEALAKRCARNHFVNELSTVTPTYRVVDANGVERHRTHGLRGGWRLDWRVSQAERNARDAVRFGCIAITAVKRQAAAVGAADPTLPQEDFKYGAWSCVSAAQVVLDNRKITPEEFHQVWCDSRPGWKEGPTFDAKAQTHPSLCDFGFLSEEEREYDLMFIEVVKACAAV